MPRNAVAALGDKVRFHSGTFAPIESTDFVDGFAVTHPNPAPLGRLKEEAA